MKLTIIIPVHNEEKTIGKIIDQVSSLYIGYDKEIIVVDDGSTDDTFNILSSLKFKIDFKLLRHDKNLGKGQALKTAFSITTGDLLIIQDADLEYDPNEIPSLLLSMRDDVSVVYGRRSDKVWPKRGFHYVIGAKILTWLTNILFNSKLNDVYTGYKLFNLRKIDILMLKNLKSRGFEFEAEVTCKILKNKGKIVEVPIYNYHPRNILEGKHINYKDAIWGAFVIIKNRF